MSTAGFLQVGMCSVACRQLNAKDIIALAREARLSAIEWGGDVHVPPGNDVLAREVGDLTRRAGLRVAGYGSYFRLGDQADFGPTLETAKALGAVTIRVWAGRRASAAYSYADRAKLTDELGAIARQAARCGLRVSLEHHENTAADDFQRTAALLLNTHHEAARTHWQLLPGLDSSHQAESLRRLGGHVAALHVFFRTGEPPQLATLAEGQTCWEKLLPIAAAHRVPDALLEFVSGSSPRQLLADAALLRVLAAEARAAWPAAGSSLQASVAHP